MTESMCALMRMREWVQKNEWRAKTWRKWGVDEQRRVGKNKENGIDISACDAETGEGGSEEEGVRGREGGRKKGREVGREGGLRERGRE